MVFLVSPARTNGLRADQLAVSRSPMGEALRAGRAPLGDVFTWLSALYFRGKLTYAHAFAERSTYIMAPGLGLVPAAHPIGVAELRAMAAIDIESDAFAEPLRRDATRLRHRGHVVLLGSIATGKYVDTLLDVFGARLVFPASFVGRGDMSRGGLLLRAARAGTQLEYTPVQGAVRHGKRPPRLPRVASTEPRRSARQG
ncbi:MAG: hypothetical protein JO257_29895 [Deltaproteobacteria bacterium]|nr:hypothetical protein [Deltaproteobacteria bacterium]